MAPDELTARLRKQPFVPFRMTLSEGSTYEIRHPELCMVGRRSAVIGVIKRDRPDRLFDWSVDVDLLHIVKLEPIEPAFPAGGGSSESEG
jgi:hypothetical protein